MLVAEFMLKWWLNWTVFVFLLRTPLKMVFIALYLYGWCFDVGMDSRGWGVIAGYCFRHSIHMFPGLVTSSQSECQIDHLLFCSPALPAENCSPCSKWKVRRMFFDLCMHTQRQMKREYLRLDLWKDPFKMVKEADHKETFNESETYFGFQSKRLWIVLAVFVFMLWNQERFIKVSIAPERMGKKHLYTLHCWDWDKKNFFLRIIWGDL